MLTSKFRSQTAATDVNLFICVHDISPHLHNLCFVKIVYVQCKYCDPLLIESVVKKNLSIVSFICIIKPVQLFFYTEDFYVSLEINKIKGLVLAQSHAAPCNTVFMHSWDASR